MVFSKVLNLVTVVIEGPADLVQSKTTETEFLTGVKVGAGHQDVVAFNEARQPLEVAFLGCFLCLVRMYCTRACRSEHSLNGSSIFNLDSRLVSVTVTGVAVVERRNAETGSVVLRPIKAMNGQKLLRCGDEELLKTDRTMGVRSGCSSLSICNSEMSDSRTRCSLRPRSFSTKLLYGL